MAVQRVKLTLESDTCERVVARARSHSSTMQNVVAEACRALVGEPQRGVVGHSGRRPESLKGGPPDLTALPGWPAPTLVFEIGATTFASLEQVARRESRPVENVIVAALQQWVGKPSELAPMSAAGQVDEARYVMPAVTRAVPGSLPAADPALSVRPTPGGGTASDRIVLFARDHLRDILDLSGQVLYSGASSLKPGEVYLLGLNPGGNPENPDLMKIRENLDDLVSPEPARREKNSYLVPWSSGNTLRKRVVWFLEHLGLRVSEIAASNLIFPRSRNEEGCQYERFADTCWAVHEQVLDIVRPRLIVTYGNTPYRFLVERFGRGGEQTCPSGHGDWACRSFDVPGRFRVVGVPHFSLYAIDHHPEVVDWTRQLMNAPR